MLMRSECNPSKILVLVSFALVTLGTGCDEPTADGDADADADLGGDASDSDAQDADPDASPEDGDVVDGDLEDADPEPPPLPTEADLERLSDIVERLSTDEMLGRLTGTPSGDVAEQMVLEFLEATGLEIATQDVVFPLFEVTTPVELSVIDDEGNALTTFGYIDDYREVDFSGSGRVEGEVVFVGYGLDRGDYDAYEGIDVTGRIVVSLTGIPAGHGLVAEDDGRLDLKVDEAFEHGAIGVIFVPAGDDATYDRQSPHEMELRATDKYFAFHADLHHPELPVAFLHVDSVDEVLGVSAASLARTAPGTPFEPRLRLEINGTVHEEAECRNVFGILRGTDEALGDEVILLGAHYDHIGVGADGRVFNGAADNASGTGIVLETAATVAAIDREPLRTIVFALFCAEEQGLWGSAEYVLARDPLFPIDDTVLMFQVDYIGGPDGPYLSNASNSYTILETFVGSERSSEELPLMYENWGGNCASDDCPFLYSGVMAYRFIAYGDYHHVAEDDFATLDMTMIDRVADVLIRGFGRTAF
jgi:hypothetical protein